MTVSHGITFGVGEQAAGADPGVDSPAVQAPSSITPKTSLFTLPTNSAVRIFSFARKLMLSPLLQERERSMVLQIRRESRPLGYEEGSEDGECLGQVTGTSREWTGQGIRGRGPGRRSTGLDTGDFERSGGEMSWVTQINIKSRDVQRDGGLG